MTLEILSHSKAASAAGDQHLFETRVPQSEVWTLLAVQAMNGTTISVCRLEVLDPAGHVQVIKTHHQGRVTNFDGLEWEGELVLPGNWQFRVLITYCASADLLDGQALYIRRVVG